MNTAPQTAQSIESLVALAGMTAFADDCDRLLKRPAAPTADRGAEPDPRPPLSLGD